MPIKSRIDFKIPFLTYKVVRVLSHLENLIAPYHSTRPLHSQNWFLESLIVELVAKHWAIRLLQPFNPDETLLCVFVCVHLFHALFRYWQLCKRTQNIKLHLGVYFISCLAWSDHSWLAHERGQMPKLSPCGFHVGCGQAQGHQRKPCDIVACMIQHNFGTIRGEQCPFLSPEDPGNNPNPLATAQDGTVVKRHDMLQSFLTDPSPPQCQRKRMCFLFYKVFFFSLELQVLYSSSFVVETIQNNLICSISRFDSWLCVCT